MRHLAKITTLTLIGVVVLLYWSFGGGFQQQQPPYAQQPHTGFSAPQEPAKVPVPAVLPTTAPAAVPQKEQGSSGQQTESQIAPLPSKSPAKSTPAKWAYKPSRDRNSHALTEAQCNAAFPDLYKEIDRAAGFWTERVGKGNIRPNNIDLAWSWDGGLRVMIYDQQLYVIGSRGLNHFGHWRDRSMATLHQLQRAIVSSREPVPNIEFSIKINDKIELKADFPNTTVWAFSRDVTDPVMDQTWLIPDFNFWNYNGVSGSFADFQRQAMELDSPMAQKKAQLVWRGTIIFNPGIREALLKQSKDKPWSDVRKVDEGTNDADQISHKLTMPDHCKYQFAAHTEGTTWSGRLKYLLSCHAVAVVHKLTWTTHLYHLLNPSGPDQNYLAVDPNWEDLPDKIENLLRNPDEAQRIADNAAAHFRDRYFTPAAQTCYWRQLMRTWRDMSFEPDPYEYKKQEDGSVVKKWRGMTYEEYVFWEVDYPPPPPPKPAATKGP